MPERPDHHQSGKHRGGPGPVSYIAGLSVAAIAGFAVAGLWLSSDNRTWRETGEPVRAETSSRIASADAHAAQPSAGMDKLVVNDVPRNVPEFDFIDGDGAARSLADWRGQYLLVNIWATWCAPCKEEMPALSRLEAKRGGEDFAVLPISVDRGGLDKPRAFLQQIGADNLPLLLEESGRLNVTLDVRGLPATLIIDPDGRQIARMLGPAEWDAPKAIARLEELMAR